MKEKGKSPEKRLQDLASGLAFTKGRFTADDVRERLGARARPRRRWGLVAAAVLALAVTHGGAYMLGSRIGDTAEEAPRELGPVAETERILTRASNLDESLPHDVLRDELGGLRRDIVLAGLPERLRATDDERAPRMADALAELQVVLDSMKDPGFSVMMVARIARTSLEGKGELVRMLPGSASSYAHVWPLADNRFRVYVVDPSRGIVVDDEGTLAELRRLHPEIQFVTGEK